MDETNNPNEAVTTEAAPAEYVPTVSRPDYGFPPDEHPIFANPGLLNRNLAWKLIIFAGRLGVTFGPYSREVALEHLARVRELGAKALIRAECGYTLNEELVTALVEANREDEARIETEIAARMTKNAQDLSAYLVPLIINQAEDAVVGQFNACLQVAKEKELDWNFVPVLSLGDAGE